MIARINISADVVKIRLCIILLFIISSCLYSIGSWYWYWYYRHFHHSLILINITNFIIDHHSSIWFGLLMFDWPIDCYIISYYLFIIEYYKESRPWFYKNKEFNSYHGISRYRIHSHPLPHSTRNLNDQRYYYPATELFKNIL